MYAALCPCFTKHSLIDTVAGPHGIGAVARYAPSEVDERPALGFNPSVPGTVAEQDARGVLAHREYQESIQRKPTCLGRQGRPGT